MPYKDPEKQKSYARNWQRAKRAGESKSSVELIHRTLNPEEVKTAGALLVVLTGLIGELLSSKQGDIFLKARTVGYLVSIGLRAIEVSDLETRLTALENKVLGVKHE